MAELQISIPGFLSVELVAAAMLALWVVVRFPRRGPQSVRGAGMLVGLALVAVQLAPAGLQLAGHLPFGVYAGLFGCVLPSFFGVFLSGAWLMRVLASAFGGSGGGGGHRVPIASR
jgi:hypothetical protein